MLSIVLTGCALTPPDPPRCEGEFRPVNTPVTHAPPTSAAPRLALCSKGAVHG